MTYLFLDYILITKPILFVNITYSRNIFLDKKPILC